MLFSKRSNKSRLALARAFFEQAGRSKAKSAALRKRANKCTRASRGARTLRKTSQAEPGGLRLRIRKTRPGFLSLDCGLKTRPLRSYNQRCVKNHSRTSPATASATRAPLRLPSKAQTQPSRQGTRCKSGFRKRRVHQKHDVAPRKPRDALPDDVPVCRIGRLRRRRAVLYHAFGEGRHDREQFPGIFR